MLLLLSITFKGKSTLAFKSEFVANSFCAAAKISILILSSFLNFWKKINVFHKTRETINKEVKTATLLKKKVLVVKFIKTNIKVSRI